MFFDTSHNQPWRTRIRIPSMPKLPLTASFGKFDASFLPSLLMVVLGALTPTGASAAKGDDPRMSRESIFPARAVDLNRQVSLSGFPPDRVTAHPTLPADPTPAGEAILPPPLRLGRHGPD